MQYKVGALWAGRCTGFRPPRFSQQAKAYTMYQCQNAASTSLNVQHIQRDVLINPEGAWQLMLILNALTAERLPQASLFRG